MSQQEQQDKSQYFYRASAADFIKIPGGAVAYWISKSVRDTFINGETFEELARPRQGLGTGNNAKFTRLWFEVSKSKIALGCKTKYEALSSNARWFPYTKGGGFKKWYGNELDVVNWADDGAEIKQALKGMNPNIPRSEEHYFKNGITWGLITSSNFSARLCDFGSIFDVGGSKAMPSDTNLYVILGFLNSKISSFLLKTLNPTLNFQVGDLKKLPIVGLEQQIKHESLIKEIVQISRNDWNSKEISMGFCSHKFLSYKTNSLQQAWDNNLIFESSLVAKLIDLECKVNKELIYIYGVQDEIDGFIDKKEVSLECNPDYLYGNGINPEENKTRYRSDTICEFISFLIGLMQGRYSIDKPGLILASQGETLQDYLNQIPNPRFMPDNDAILPLTDQEWFTDDVTNRVREFVKVVWGEETLQENLTFIAESLCLHAIKPKKSEGALDTIRRYLSTQFYKDHLKTYKKRPIYWLFSSGKEKAFECLVYLHRYNESTLARMRTEYVTPLMGKYDAQHSLLLEQKTDASPAQQRELEKEIKALEKKQTELRAFDEQLKHHADMRIKLDLDDGVKVNYGKFGNLLAEVKAVTGDKGD